MRRCRRWTTRVPSMPTRPTHGGGRGAGADRYPGSHVHGPHDGRPGHRQRHRRRLRRCARHCGAPGPRCDCGWAGRGHGRARPAARPCGGPTGRRVAGVAGNAVVVMAHAGGACRVLSRLARVRGERAVSASSTSRRRDKPSVLPGLRIAAKLAHMNPITTARPCRPIPDEPLDACVEWPVTSGRRPGAALQKATICPVAFCFRAVSRPQAYRPAFVFPFRGTKHVASRSEHPRFPSGR